MPLSAIQEYLVRTRSVVSVRSNLRVYLSRLALALLGAALLGAGYIVGVKDFIELGAVEIDEYESLYEEYRNTLSLFSDLEEKKSQLDVNAQIDLRAQEALRGQLIEMQTEIKRLNDELLFYRHLHESDSLVEGLRVQSFELRPVANAEGRFRFRSIVSFFSAAERNSFFEGYYEIVVEARRQGASEEAAPELVTVTPSSRSKRKYKFKLIHTIKGEFELDPKLNPVRIFFRLQPRSGKFEGIEKIYSFKELADPSRQY